jgi:hypothetical protein
LNAPRTYEDAAYYHKYNTNDTETLQNPLHILTNVYAQYSTGDKIKKQSMWHTWKIKEVHTEFWWRVHLEDPSIDGRIL